VDWWWEARLDPTLFVIIAPGTYGQSGTDTPGAHARPGSRKDIARLFRGLSFPWIPVGLADRKQGITGTRYAASSRGSTYRNL